MVARIAAVDAVVAIPVNMHVELFTGLHERLGKLEEKVNQQ